MTQLWLATLVIVGGLGLAVQAAVNSRLRAGVHSPPLSALISFLVGAAALLLITASGAFGRAKFTDWNTLPWWAWVGGLLGAVYVLTAIIAVPRIGTAAVVACGVFGQIVASLVLDNMGWFGVPRIPLTGTRIAGAVLLLAGVLLMQRK